MSANPAYTLGFHWFEEAGRARECYETCFVVNGGTASVLDAPEGIQRRMRFIVPCNIKAVDARDRTKARACSCFFLTPAPNSAIS